MDIREYLIVNAPPMPVDFRHNDREKYNPYNVKVPAMLNAYNDKYYAMKDEELIKFSADWAVRYADAVIERMAVK